MAGANFADACLIQADLTGTNLGDAVFARANLQGAASSDLAKRFESVLGMTAEFGKNSTTLLLLLLTTVGYCLLTAMIATDDRLVPNAAITSLPVVPVQVPIGQFLLRTMIDRLMRCVVVRNPHISRALIRHDACGFGLSGFRNAAG